MCAQTFLNPVCVRIVKRKKSLPEEGGFGVFSFLLFFLDVDL